MLLDKKEFLGVPMTWSTVEEFVSWAKSQEELVEIFLENNESIPTGSKKRVAKFKVPNESEGVTIIDSDSFEPMYVKYKPDCKFVFQGIMVFNEAGTLKWFRTPVLIPPDSLDMSTAQRVEKRPGDVDVNN